MKRAMRGLSEASAKLRIGIPGGEEPEGRELVDLAGEGRSPVSCRGSRGRVDAIHDLRAALNEIRPQSGRPSEWLSGEVLKRTQALGMEQRGAGVARSFESMRSDFVCLE